MVELLKQPQYQPFPVEEQVLSLYAGTKGFLDDVEIKSVPQWEKDFIQFARDKHSSLLTDLREKGELSDTISEQIEAAIKDFKAGYKPPATT